MKRRNRQGRPTARSTALDLLEKVDRERAYVNKLLLDVSRGERFDRAEQSLIQQLVRGTLENRARLDEVIAGRLNCQLEELTPPALNILRLGAYQLLFLNRVSRSRAVSECVDLARARTHDGVARVVNAVLRRISEEPPGELHGEPGTVTGLATRYSHPEWIVARWISQLGFDEAEALCQADNRPWPLYLRTNTLRIGAEALIGRLKAEGWLVRPGRYAEECLEVVSQEGRGLHELDAYRQGLFMVQDQSSILVGRLLDPRSGDSVIDLCSAPGGKASHLAALMANRGSITAVDVNQKRLRLVEENCARLGVAIVGLRIADGRMLTAVEADKVLLDAPCSGLGVLGRRADLRWNRLELDMPALIDLQTELLESAAKLVTPGGRLVYSTCSVDREENEGVVKRFLATNPQYCLSPIDGFVAPELITADGFMRTWPHRQSMAGGFAAVLRRTGTAGSD